MIGSGIVIDSYWNDRLIGGQENVGVEINYV